jgi:ABC-type transport system involved in multi-copper enzyme maturation permease subunit
MTALTMPARPGEDDAGLRPVPWRRMAGVTWRQHRIALAGVAVLLGALAVWLWTAGTPLHRAYAAAVACHPASSPACQNLISTFNASATNHFMGSKGAGGVLLQLVPVLIGAFAGAPVLARELETGTFRYAWTQGFGRWRWALAKLVLLAVVLAAAAAAFGVLVSWYYQPYSGTGNQVPGLYQNSPFATLFSLREVTFPAWTLAAFAIGALAGMLIRRVVPAIVATLAAYTGLAFVTAGLLREHYLTPLVTTSLNLPATAWIISQWSTKEGRFAFAGNPPTNVVNQFCSSLAAGKAGPPGAGYAQQLAQCLAQHGYTQWTSYQPASRFWPFQWIEGGWLLALSALLIAATIWLVQRRAA